MDTTHTAPTAAAKTMSERIATRYGERAELQLTLDEQGCQALLRLPLDLLEPKP